MTDKETELPDIDRAHTIVQETMSNLIDSADVAKVYGRPIKQGDVTVVPASENLTFWASELAREAEKAPAKIAESERAAVAVEEGARSPGRWRLSW